MPLIFFQHSCLLNAGLEHSSSDLVFKQPRLRDQFYFIFGMLYYLFANCIQSVWNLLILASLSQFLFVKNFIFQAKKQSFRKNPFVQYIVSMSSVETFFSEKTHRKRTMVNMQNIFLEDHWQNLISLSLQISLMWTKSL